MCLNQNQVEEYIRIGGAKCPYCDSEDMDSGQFQADQYRAWQDVKCCGCGREWTDEYGLTGITEMESKKAPLKDIQEDILANMVYCELHAMWVWPINCQTCKCACDGECQC